MKCEVAFSRLPARAGARGVRLLQGGRAQSNLKKGKGINKLEYPVEVAPLEVRQVQLQRDGAGEHRGVPAGADHRARRRRRRQGGVRRGAGGQAGRRARRRSRPIATRSPSIRPRRRSTRAGRPRRRPRPSWRAGSRPPPSTPGLIAGEEVEQYQTQRRDGARPTSPRPSRRCASRSSTCATPTCGRRSPASSSRAPSRPGSTCSRAPSWRRSSSATRCSCASA